MLLSLNLGYKNLSQLYISHHEIKEPIFVNSKSSSCTVQHTPTVCLFENVILLADIPLSLLQV